MDIVRRKLMHVADLQWGRVSARQLRDLGATEGRITRWIRDGYLRQVLPHVYAVGHMAESVEGDLIAAVLYAGPGATLSHATALWWHGLLEHQPVTRQVSTPRKCVSCPEVQVYGRRTLELIHHRRLPATTVSQALLDFSATAPVNSVVRVLAEADYRRMLNHAELRAICGYGRRGSATLKKALRRHTPELARTKSPLETAFHALCRRGHIPAYKVNHPLCGFTVDAFWPDLGVVVELDGVRGHATAAQMRRDHGRDLILRAAGYIVVRYSYQQVMYEGDAVLADLRMVLEGAERRRASLGATTSPSAPPRSPHARPQTPPWPPRGPGWPARSNRTA